MEKESTPQVCPICNSEKHMGKEAKPLYGQLVCKKCADRFANRRQAAFIIDLFLWCAALVTIGFFVEQTLSEGVTILLSALAWLVFFLKDGLFGYSPGKFLCGIQVIHEPTGQPAIFGSSFKRNFLLIVPFIVLFIAFDLRKGYRFGDKWAKTRVIWNKYGDKAPFSDGIFT